MNLEKLKVVELDALEVKSIEGGFLPLLLVAALCCTGCAATYQPVKVSGTKLPAQPGGGGGGGGW
jgi:hypothetical protein